jgi:hypothetical protein
LSTTTTVAPSSLARSRLARQASVSSRRFQLSTTIHTSRPASRGVDHHQDRQRRTQSVSLRCNGIRTARREVESYAARPRTVNAHGRRHAVRVELPLLRRPCYATGTMDRRYWHLTVQLARKDFKIRYTHSVLGYAWSVVNPLIFSLVYFLVFSIFIRFDVPFYAAYLLLGIVLWTFFAEGSAHGVTSLLARASLVTKVAFPRQVIVYAAC